MSPPFFSCWLLPSSSSYPPTSLQHSQIWGHASVTLAAQVLSESTQAQAELNIKVTEKISSSGKVDKRQEEVHAVVHLFIYFSKESLTVQRWGRSKRLPGVGLHSSGRFLQRGCRDLLASTGSLSPGIQKHGALHVNRGRGRAQGEEKDPVCCAGLHSHQPGPSASGDGELAVHRLRFDPWGQISISC